MLFTPLTNRSAGYRYDDVISRFAWQHLSDIRGISHFKSLQSLSEEPIKTSYSKNGENRTFPLENSNKKSTILNNF